MFHPQIFKGSNPFITLYFFIKMTNKINPNILRLNIRKNWSITTGFDIFRFSNLQYKNSNLTNTISLLTSNFDFYSKISLVKNAKHWRFFSKVIGNTQIVDSLLPYYPVNNPSILPITDFSLKKSVFDSQNFSLKHRINKKFNSLAYTALNNKNFLFEFSKQQKLQTNKKLALSITKHFFLVDPLLISDFIITQLQQPSNLQNPYFTKNLQSNIFKILCAFLTIKNKKRQSINQPARIKIKSIIGIKIECSGRWKKTKSGRKQKLHFSYGVTPRTGVVNKIFTSFFVILCY